MKTLFIVLLIAIYTIVNLSYNKVTYNWLLESNKMIIYVYGNIVWRKTIYLQYIINYNILIG